MRGAGAAAPLLLNPLRLALEKLRFGDRLGVRMEVDPAVKAVCLPGLLVQPLVENALKHGLAPLERGGMVVIQAAAENAGAVRIRVEDTAGAFHGRRLPERGRGSRTSKGGCMAYSWLKLLHLVAVVFFLGNITTGIFWKAHADRTKDPRLMAHALEGIIRSDRWFTIPGVIGILAGGFGAAAFGRMPILGTGWILWSVALFSISGLAFMLRVVPLQRRLAALAHAGSSAGLDWTTYRAWSKSWEIWGAVATIAPFVAMVLMVLKPDLPAL